MTDSITPSASGKETRIDLVDDIHHLTFVTADLDRLLEFYEEVFGIRSEVELQEDGLRHAMIRVGPQCYLHPFQIPGAEPPGPEPMFQRGRLDHFAFHATSEEAFRELRRRAIEAGASEGIVTDMGSLWIFSFSDPDGGRHEVVWAKPDVPIAKSSKRADWTAVDMT